MPLYRVTIRFGVSRPRYELVDVEAPDLRAALRDAAGLVTDEVAVTAELAEVRRVTAPEERAYTPE